MAQEMDLPKQGEAYSTPNSFYKTYRVMSKTPACGAGPLYKMDY